MADFALLGSSTLTYCKICVIVKSCNFHTVYGLAATLWKDPFFVRIIKIFRGGRPFFKNAFWKSRSVFLKKSYNLPPLRLRSWRFLSPDLGGFRDDDLFRLLCLISTNCKSKNGVVHRKVSRGLTWTQPSFWAAIENDPMASSL